MPVIAAMPMVWPEGALDAVPEPLFSAESRWIAIKVQARCEKAVARALMERGDAYFLCLRSVHRIYQRRRVVSQMPLFPGYVFAASTDDNLASLWRVRHVSCTLPPPSQEQFLQELRDLHRVVSSGAAVTPEEQLQPGQLARITKGCLCDVTGTVVQNRGGMKLIIAVNLLGRGASVEVTPDMIERV